MVKRRPLCRYLSQPYAAAFVDIAMNEHGLQPDRRGQEIDSGPPFRRSARVNPNTDPRNGGPPEWGGGGGTQEIDCTYSFNYCKVQVHREFFQFSFTEPFSGITPCFWPGPRMIIAVGRLFTYRRIPFLSPNQQCRSTGGKRNAR